MMFREIG